MMMICVSVFRVNIAIKFIIAAVFALPLYYENSFHVFYLPSLSLPAKCRGRLLFVIAVAVFSMSYGTLTN